MWSDLKLPVIIAHRGDSMYAPENTVAAFQLAIENGADAIEFDVKLSSDEQVIVLHDQTVDRTTNGHGDVRRFSLTRLRELDAGVCFAGNFHGERIPTLEEVFEKVGGLLHMNIELTNYATPGDPLVQRVSELVKKYQMQTRVLFSSFFPNNLRKAQILLPEVPCGLLALTGLAGLPARRWGWKRGMFALHPHVSNVNGKMVAILHKANKRVHVWTVNKKVDMERLVSMGIDGIFTDDPALLRQCLGREK